MPNYTVEQRRQILESYIKNDRSARQTFRSLRVIFGRHGRPSEAAIRKIGEKFFRTHSLENTPHTRRARTTRTPANIGAVEESLTENNRLSIRRRAQALDLSPVSLWRILHQDLGLHAYKIQLVQELLPHDHLRRRTFANWALEHLENDPDFHQKIIFSDEAHFWMNGYVNKQNCRIWSNEQPKEIQETALHPEKVTVWCGLHANGILGPFFFRNDAGANVTVNGERYRDMLEDWFFPNVVTHDLEDFWFQQDGATCHTAGQTIELLNTMFEGRIISNRGNVDWPPRSCDLTPLDFFLWGYVKSLVYVDKPQTTAQLEANIVRVIQGITADVLEKGHPLETR